MEYTHGEHKYASKLCEGRKHPKKKKKNWGKSEEKPVDSHEDAKFVLMSPMKQTPPQHTQDFTCDRENFIHSNFPTH